MPEILDIKTFRRAFAKVYIKSGIEKLHLTIWLVGSMAYSGWSGHDVDIIIWGEHIKWGSKESASTIQFFQKLRNSLGFEIETNLENDEFSWDITGPAIKLVDEGRLISE